MGWRDEIQAWTSWATQEWNSARQGAWDTVSAAYSATVEADPTGALQRAEEFVAYMFGTADHKGATHFVHDIAELEHELPAEQVTAAQGAAEQKLRTEFGSDFEFHPGTLAQRVDDLAGPLMRACTDGSCGFVPLLIAGGLALSLAAAAWCYAKVFEAKAAYNESLFYREELRVRAEAMRSGRKLPAATERPPPASAGGGGGSMGFVLASAVAVGLGVWWFNREE